MFAAAGPASAEGFFDMFVGGATFAPVNATESSVVKKQSTGLRIGNGPDDQSMSHLQVGSSIAGGLRVGAMHKWERFSLGGAFVTDFYSAKAKYPYPATGSLSTAEQGGFVIQPGVDLIAGIPLRFVRLYGGAGLCTPLMSYTYTSFNFTNNTYSPNTPGLSGALGYNLFVGGRWLISNHFNLFMEDRFTNLITPLVIKNSVYSGTGNFTDSSFTFKTLNSNRIVAGVGFSW